MCSCMVITWPRKNILTTKIIKLSNLSHWILIETPLLVTRALVISGYSLPSFATPRQFNGPLILNLIATPQLKAYICHTIAMATSHACLYCDKSHMHLTWTRTQSLMFTALYNLMASLPRVIWCLLQGTMGN